MDLAAYKSTVFYKDLAALRDRLNLDPDVFSDFRDTNRTIVRWDHADDPWLEYEGYDRGPSDVASPAWQRDRPFWFILDQADRMTDEQLLSLWEDAKYAHGMVKDTNRSVRLGWSKPTSDAEDLKIWTSALAERGRVPEDLGVIL